MTFTFINLGTTEIMLLFVVPMIAIGAYAIYQCLRNPELSPIQRIVWLIIILSVPLFGCLGYLLTFRSSKHRA